MNEIIFGKTLNLWPAFLQISSICELKVSLKSMLTPSNFLFLASFFFFIIVIILFAFRN